MKDKTEWETLSFSSRKHYLLFPSLFKSYTYFVNLTFYKDIIITL